MPKSTVPAAAEGLPVSEPHGRIPVGARANIIPTDRRAFLRQLIAASALTVPVAAAALAHASQPDSELLRLGAEFERLYADYLVLCDESERLCVAAEDEADDLGLTPGSNAWFELRKENGAETAIAITNDKSDELSKIAQRIRAIPAVGINGIAVKASLLPFDVLRIEDQLALKNGVSLNDLDWDVEQLHRFVTEVRAMAGGSYV